MNFTATARPDWNLPEDTYRFKVRAVEDDYRGNSCKVSLVTDDGRTQTLFYNLDNDFGRASFSELFFAAVGQGEYGTSYDTQEMVGRHVIADIVHKKGRNGDRVFVNLANVRPDTEGEPEDDALASLGI